MNSFCLKKKICCDVVATVAGLVEATTTKTAKRIGSDPTGMATGTEIVSGTGIVIGMTTATTVIIDTKKTVIQTEKGVIKLIFLIDIFRLITSMFHYNKTKKLHGFETKIYVKLCIQMKADFLTGNCFFL
jgi:hypothetical protein